METCDLVDTLMVEKSKLDEDPQGKAVDPKPYLEMIDTLMYLTSSRPYHVFVVCMCARYQTKPTEKHLHAVKRIFRYLRGTINMGLWYSKDSCNALTTFADADHVGSMQLLDYYSDNQYAVSIKEDTAYLCLHFTKDHEEYKINTSYPGKTNTPYSSYGNKIFWKISNVVPTPRNTPNTAYRILLMRRIDLF
ncbi:hypothetical protein Tco_0913867 [Tanacetum coccineum]